MPDAQTGIIAEPGSVWDRFPLLEAEEWMGWPSSAVAVVVFAVPGTVGAVVESDWEESGLVMVAPGSVEMSVAGGETVPPLLLEPLDRKGYGGIGDGGR